jgi:membrane protease subunit (stomatin/prohibitin family)
LVVCGSIIVGVAVVPAQAAALVEALLARQAAKKASCRKVQSIGDRDQLLQLNTAMECPNCGSSFHWSNARFCYLCGKEI